MTDVNSTITELKELVQAFTTERNWGAHHTLENLAKSIVIEAAELLEPFQWNDIPDVDVMSKVRDELADVMSYVLFFAIAADIDITTAVRDKLAKSALKYPAEVFKDHDLGSQAYWQTKAQHRQ